MKKKTITAFFCEHCNKLYQIEKACVAHEKRCSKNPENKRACMDCQYLTKGEVEKWEDYPDGAERSRMVDIFFCSKIKSFLYTAQNEHKGNFFNGEDLGDGEKENVPMRKECEHFSSWNDDLLGENPF